MNAVFKSKVTSFECTGCLACFDSCGKGAISFGYDRGGHIMPSFIASHCVGCGLCDAVCPAVEENTGIKSSEKDVQAYAAWSCDDALRAHSSSGGVFAALARWFVRNGGYVAGAVIDGCEVKHILTADENEIADIQGSKYQQGISAGIYRQVRQCLMKGNKVLFSGSPCQVAAIDKFITDEACRANLYTVDFFCGGFPSILPLRRFIKDCGYEVKRIVSFRDKQNGWKSSGFRYDFKVEGKDGTVRSYGDNNIVSRSFISHLTNRDSCLDCRFATLQRPSDITIGDFWGCTDFPDQESRGISAIIFHNDRLTRIMAEAEVELRETDVRKIVRNNPRSVNGTFLGYGKFWLHKCYPAVFGHCSSKFIRRNVLGYGPGLSLLGKMNKSLIKKLKNRDSESKRQLAQNGE